MTQVLLKRDFMPWLEQLSKNYTLVVPTIVNNIALFQPIYQGNGFAKGTDILIDYDNTLLPPKQWLFPLSETLFWIEQKNQRLIAQTIKKEMVIFGIRPCDAYGISLIDKIFLSEPVDNLYMEHRDKTLLIGLACTKPSPACFCTSFQTSPHDASNLDALLIQIDDGYIVQIITDKGKMVFSTAQLVESDVSVPVAPTIVPIPIEGIFKRMYDLFDCAYWDRLAERCLQCNMCTYICPTCYCFDIGDYVNKDSIERVRSWDSCQSRTFTRQAGGIDPRNTKAARIKQRFYHKLFYFHQKFGVLSCTGCGRCIKACPVNIDIREVISDIQKLCQ